MLENLSDEELSEAYNKSLTDAKIIRRQFYKLRNQLVEASEYRRQILMELDARSAEIEDAKLLERSLK